MMVTGILLLVRGGKRVRRGPEAGAPNDREEAQGRQRPAFVVFNNLMISAALTFLCNR